LVAQAVALAGDLDDLGVVQEPVQDRRGARHVATMVRRRRQNARRRSKWLLLVLGLGLVVVIVAGVVVPWPAVERITETNTRRVKSGMSHSEVESILGRPGDYTSKPTKPSNTDCEQMFEATGEWFDPPLQDGKQIWPHEEVWQTDSARAGVYFDSRERVCASAFKPYVATAQGPLDNLLWRAKRQWHRWFPE
jgi:hypothetical protein